MQKRIYVAVAAGIMILGGLHNAKADDVYVDLSALDSLSDTTYTATMPLFPEYKAPEKKTPTVSVKKKKTPKKSVKKKAVVKVQKDEPVKSTAKAPEIKVAPQPSEEKVVVVDVEPASPQPTPTQVDNKASVAKTQPSTSVEEKSAPANANQVSPSVTQSEAIGKVEVVTNAEDKNTQEVKTQPLPEAQSSDEKQETSAQPTAPEQPIRPLVQTPSDETIKDENLSAKEKDSLLQVKFIGEEYELTAAQKQQIDSAVASFSDPKENKIAIYSYNEEDGVDAFKKKRLCLNRAVEVRGYLLQKGYKNFSIKVINVDKGSDKAGLVELEELK